MKNKFKISIFSLLLIFIVSSCIKYDFKESEINDCNLDFEPNTSIEDLVNYYGGSGEPFLIDTNLIIKGTVIANDKSGNYYKSFVIQDSTETGEQTGLLVSIDEYETHNKYHVGDMIYIKCEGLYLGFYGEVIQLGGLFEGAIGRIEEPLVDQYIFKACGGKPIVPRVVTIDQLAAVPVNTLIQLNDVQFKLGELDETFADAIESETTEQILSDCSNRTAVIRTSGYADFASQMIPEGNGSLVCINGRFEGTPQLLIRDVKEVKLNDERCGALYEKDFEEIVFGEPGGSLIENFTSGNWFSYNVIGETLWETAYHSGNNYANITNYNYETGSNSASEAWLISPAFDLTLLTTPVLNFITAYNYTGPLLQVKISTDYSGEGDPGLATWDNLNPELSDGEWNWVNSGDLDLTVYKQSSVYLAFVYTGSNSSGATWELDNIQFRDNN